MSKYDNIVEVVGKTPSVRFHKIGADLDCEFWGKCEYLNPGGSAKDRIGVRMIIEAERRGRIKPGDTLIEPTSGNTGIGMAMTAAVGGYRLIIVMPDRMSKEKEITMRSLGAEIVRTPSHVPWDSPESYISTANRLQKEIPNSHVLDQYSNPDNADAHYYGTGSEILEDFPEGLDMVVMGVGTGGTITGVARRLREAFPKVQIVGADPEGSILSGGGHASPFHVEGIGYDFFPEVLDSSLIDRYVKTTDRDTFLMARRLIREEGLLVGGSSGAATCAALEAARDLGPGARCLILLPDSIRNYMTKFLDDAWMIEKGFLDEA